MTKVLRVRKTVTSQAIQITDEESENLVLSWLQEMGAPNWPDLSSLKEKGFWFLREEGDIIVYVAAPEDFDTRFETLGEEDVAPTIQVAPYQDPFKFGD